MNTLRLQDSVHFFIDELKARVIAESGIPSDRFHLGKLILKRFKDDPDFIAQIDGANGEKETCGSLLKRSIQCANYFKSQGLKRGDVIVLMAPNHLDAAVPFYAGLYLGIILAPISPTEPASDLVHHIRLLTPKLIIAQSEKTSDISEAVKKSNIDTTIITFDTGSHYKVLSDILKKYENDTKVDEFRAEDFDPEETLALLVATSGTTGFPKYVCSTHKNFAATGHYIWTIFKEFPLHNPMHLMLSPMRWSTGCLFFVMSPIMKITRLQTSQTFTPGHIHHVINKYKPANLVLSTPLMHMIVKSEGYEQCDFSCFENISVGGCNVPGQLIEDIKALSHPNALVSTVYGMSECSGVSTMWNNSPSSSCGVPLRHGHLRLVDVDTQQEITEPNKPGELQMKGPAVCKGYYKNSEETKETFTEDGWLRSGDILYQDENWNFYYVERFKLFLKYKADKVAPVTVENVIFKLPGVLDVAVTGLPHAGYGDLVTACVVRKPGSSITAQEIKNIVKDSLPDSHQLRGGVVFMHDMPLNSSQKLDRMKLREVVQQMTRE